MRENQENAVVLSKLLKNYWSGRGNKYKRLLVDETWLSSSMLLSRFDIRMKLLCCAALTLDGFVNPKREWCLSYARVSVIHSDNHPKNRAVHGRE
jgi:hypothetical protein